MQAVGKKEGRVFGAPHKATEEKLQILGERNDPRSYARAGERVRPRITVYVPLMSRSYVR